MALVYFIQMHTSMLYHKNISVTKENISSMDKGKATAKIAGNKVQEALHFRYLKFLVILPGLSVSRIDGSTDALR